MLKFYNSPTIARTHSYPPSFRGILWDSIKEKEFSDEYFYNYYDPYLRSKYKTLYDVQTTPQIFILNRKHEILMKRIGAEQLGDVMEQVMKFQEEKKKQGNK